MLCIFSTGQIISQMPALLTRTMEWLRRQWSHGNTPCMPRCTARKTTDTATDMDLDTTMGNMEKWASGRNPPMVSERKSYKIRPTSIISIWRNSILFYIARQGSMMIRPIQKREASMGIISRNNRDHLHMQNLLTTVSAQSPKYRYPCSNRKKLGCLISFMSDEI